MSVFTYFAKGSNDFSRAIRGAPIHEWYGVNDETSVCRESPPIDEWSPDPDVSCALPDLQWVVWTALGAVAVVLALGWWVVQQVRVKPR